MCLTCEDQKQQLLSHEYMLGKEVIKESSHKVEKYIPSKL